MNKRLKEFLGDEVYNYLTEKGVKVKDIDVIANNYIPKSRFDEVNQETKNLKEKVTNYEKQIKETTKLVKDNEELKNNFETLNSKYNDERVGYDKTIANLTKSTRVREHLLNEGAINGKSLDLLMKDVDLDKLSIENDKLIGISDMVKSLKTDCKHMFVEKQSSGKPPKDTNNDDPQDKGSDLGIFGEVLNNNQGW